MAVRGPASARGTRLMMPRMSLACQEPMEKEENLEDEEKEEVLAEGEGHGEEGYESRRYICSETGGTNGQGLRGRGLQIPPDFRCPLSLELMSDPVIVSSGQTYEKAFIQQWLDQGNTTCPKTRQTLTHRNLIPNYTVKALIANWCEGNHVPLPESRNAVLRPLTISARLNGEPPEERPVSPPRPVQEPPPNRSQELRSSSSGGSSRSFGISRLTLQSTGSLNDRDFDANGFQSVFEDFNGEKSQRLTRSPRRHGMPDTDRRIALLKEKYDVDSGNESSSPRPRHRQSGSGSSIASSGDEVQGSSNLEYANAPVQTSIGSSPYQSDASGELEKVPITHGILTNDDIGSPRIDRMSPGLRRRHGEEREASMPRIVSSPLQDNLLADGNVQQVVDGLVMDLESTDVEVHRRAAAELRLLAKHNMENRIIIANSGAIRPLVELLRSTDPVTQENAVTALLNLSINDNNKTEIAAAGAIHPLVNVLRVGNTQAMENSAATLFSLSVIDENKVTIGGSGAIPPLVHLLIHGTPRGKKDAATALFNLSIFHENKARIVRAGAIRPLVELMADPAAGMVDKAVAVLANLATIPEGRVAIGDEGGIPALVEVVEAGSQRGKENAAAALLQLCMNSHRHRALVLQEGAIPPLVALSQSGTARAKEKASALLRHFREQRHQVGAPRPAHDNHNFGHYYS